MKFNNLLIVCIQFYFCYAIKVTPSIQKRTSTCGVSSIKISLGTTLPIMTYNARENEKRYNLTYVPEELKNNFNSSQYNQTSINIQNSTWFTNDTKISNVSESLNLCFRLNEEILSKKEYESNGKYAKYRITEQNDKKDEEHSFLIIDESIEEENSDLQLSNEDIDDLDKIIDHSENPITNNEDQLFL